MYEKQPTKEIEKSYKYMWIKAINIITELGEIRKIKSQTMNFYVSAIFDSGDIFLISVFP